MGQYINYYNSKKKLWDFKENMNRDLLFLEGFQGQKAIPQNCHTLTAQSAMQFAVLMKPRVGITHCFMDLGGQSFFCFFLLPGPYTSSSIFVVTLLFPQMNLLIPAVLYSATKPKYPLTKGFWCFKENIIYRRSHNILKWKESAIIGKCRELNSAFYTNIYMHLEPHFVTFT